jgi:hypothetical protein
MVRYDGLLDRSQSRDYNRPMHPAELTQQGGQGLTLSLLPNFRNMQLRCFEQLNRLFSRYRG